MKKDGSKVLFFKLDELMNYCLLPVKNSDNLAYKCDKLMIFV